MKAAENAVETEYSPRLLDHDTGNEIAPGEQALAPEDIFPGNVLTIRQGGAKRHYLIQSVEGDPVQEARLVPAKSSLKKGLLLLAILAATWFALRYLIGFFAT